MTVELQLVSTLGAASGFDALADGRVYPLILPVGATLPAVVYQRISGPRVHAVGSSSFLASPRVQFGCIATTYAAAKALADELSAALDGVQGSMNDDADPAAMWMAQVVGDIDDYEPETGRYRVIVDVVVTHDD